MTGSVPGHLRSGWPIALLLTALSLPTHAKDAPLFDPAGDPAALASSFIKAEKLQALKGVKRVAFAQFRVEFAVENDASAQSSGTAGWTASKSDIKLVGVTDEARQAITDALFDRFVQDLTAAGVEVVPYETVRATPGYQSIGPVMHTKQEPTGTRTGKSIFVGAKGTPYYTTNDDKHLSLGSMLGGFSTTQPQNYEPQVAKALDATVLRVTLMVAFADQAKSGGMFNNASSVKTAARLAIIPELSQVLFITPNSGKARVYLDQAVLMEGAEIEMKDTTTGGEKAAQVMAGLIGGGMRTERHYTATTTADAYTSVVEKYGLAVESAMMSTVRAGVAAAP
jgi:hypothetical protein